LFLDGKLIENARWGIARYDVFKKYRIEESYESGFLGKINLKDLKGDHILKVVTKSNNHSKILGQSTLRIVKREPGDSPPVISNLAAGESGQFKFLGKKYLEYFKELTNLKPNDKVLEIGCGLGRFALPLTKFLNKEGQYYALDVIPAQIEYCKENISGRYPNFHFTLADIYNGLYNRTGKYSASKFKFPYENNFFDLVFLHSVFSHMVLNDVSNYLSEIARILKPSKYCFITYFITNRQGSSTPEQLENDSRFKFKFEGYSSSDQSCPENRIAYDEIILRDLYDDNGLKILEPIFYLGTKNSLTGQDVIIAVKK